MKSTLAVLGSTPLKLESTQPLLGLTLVLHRRTTSFYFYLSGSTPPMLKLTPRLCWIFCSCWSRLQFCWSLLQDCFSILLCFWLSYQGRSLHCWSQLWVWHSIFTVLFFSARVDPSIAGVDFETGSINFMFLTFLPGSTPPLLELTLKLYFQILCIKNTFKLMKNQHKINLLNVIFSHII